VTNEEGAIVLPVPESTPNEKLSSPGVSTSDIVLEVTNSPETPEKIVDTKVLKYNKA